MNFKIIILIVALVNSSFSQIELKNSLQEIEKDSNKTINRKLYSIGYQKIKEKEIIGGVAIINSFEIPISANASILQMLQGRVAGAWVGNEYSPGSGTMFRIRGFGTPSNNNPLIVIDGVPTQGNLNFINPNDIETITVLKDASTTSIYGARGGNGVIEISTKKAESGKPTINFDMFTGIQMPSNLLEMMDTKEFGEYLYLSKNSNNQNNKIYSIYNFGPNGEQTIADYINPIVFGSLPSDYSYTSDYKNPAFGKTAFNITKSNKNGTDWLDVLFDPAKISNYNLAISKAFKKTKFNVSGNYFKQDGIMRFTNYERKSIRANSEFNLGNFTFGENISYSNDSHLDINPIQNIVQYAVSVPPVYSVFDISGGPLALGGTNSDNQSGFGPIPVGVFLNGNPLAIQYNNRNNTTQQNVLFGNVFGEIKFFKKLFLRTSFGQEQNSQRNQFERLININSDPSSTNYFETVKNDYKMQALTNTLNYKSFLNKYSLDILIGHEILKYDFKARKDYQNGVNIGASGNNLSYGIKSFFGKIGAKYKELFSTEIQTRADMSGIYAVNSNPEYFGSIAVNFKLSELLFFKNKLNLDYLNFRLGIGSTSNRGNIGTVKNKNFYTAEYSNTQSLEGLSPKYVGATNSFNTGLNANFFNNKLFFTIDAYIRNTVFKGFFTNINLNPGNSNTYNIGGSGSQTLQNPLEETNKFRNVGIDLNLAYNFKVNAVKGNVGINFSYLHNSVKKLNIGSGNVHLNFSSFGTNTITIKNEPLANFYGYKVDGIIKDESDLMNSPKIYYGSVIGGYKFKDLNNDKIIDNKDRTIIGSPIPKYIFGLNMNFEYKSFDLSIFGQGVLGNKISHSLKFWTDLSPNAFPTNHRKNILQNTWQKIGDNASLPKIGSINSNPMDYYIENGSYIRLKTTRLSYKLPFRKNSFAKIFIQGENLITLTKYSGMNPDITLQSPGSSFEDVKIGVDYGVYPSSKNYIIGISLGF